MPGSGWLLIMSLVARRLHVPRLSVGRLPLDAAQAHHARDVLRLHDGAVVEVFDDAGAIAWGVLAFHREREASVRVEQVEKPASNSLRWTIAAAVPKGERADWMVEKISELGTHAFIPLAADRSVVLPEGKGKRERWLRIATESAKQSRRHGVIRIEPLMSVQRVLAERVAGAAWFCSTASDVLPIPQAAAALEGTRELLLFVGPEGGWTDEEFAAFHAANVTPVALASTTLRIETAAVAAAAVLASFRRR